jgi:four helix bundle protein
LPREELYGLTSQLRRASLSVALNYIEGYARVRNLVHKSFLEISYGSLQEAAYLIEFLYLEKMIPEADFLKLMQQKDEIGAMLWSTINKINT